MRKNGFLTFIFACVPGCGQMYQGYMRRGVSLAFWFWGMVFIAGVLNFELIVFLMPVIWAFAFFDTFNLRALTIEQRMVFRDDFIPNQAFFAQYMKLKPDVMYMIFGWGLIGFGGLLIYNTLIQGFLWRFMDGIIGSFVYNLVPLAIGILVIVLGLKMLGKNRKNANKPDDDIPYWSDKNE